MSSPEIPEPHFGDPDAPYDANGKVLHSHRVWIYQDKTWKDGPGWNARCHDCAFVDWHELYEGVRHAAMKHLQGSPAVMTNG